MTAVADDASPATPDLPEVVDAVAVARLYGEPLFQMPLDLYIPPDALEVFLEAFQGPLDLLLYLIRRQNLDILDIKVAEITEQYMRYVALMKALHLELAAEYLVMDAMLAEIKSRMLLPRPQGEGGQDEEDPRAELVRRLQEYERFKQAAAITLAHIWRSEQGSGNQTFGAAEVPAFGPTFSIPNRALELISADRLTPGIA